MTKAFDLALFVGTPVNVNDASVVSALGPPFATAFKPVALSGKAGATLNASLPAAVASNQILVSGSGPNFDWGLATNPAAAATVPPPGQHYDIVMADGTPAWTSTPLSTALTVAGAVLNSSGAAFGTGANITFAPAATARVRLDGVDPALSILDNFSWDAGTF